MFNGAQGLVDISWEQQVPLIQPDDMDKDLFYNQYPYQEADDYDDEEEEMEIDDQIPGNAGDTCMAAPTGTRHPYQCPPVSYTTYTDHALGSPRSIHTDTDTAMEFSTLQVAAQSAPPQWLARNIIPPQGPTRNVPPQGLAKEITAPDLVSHLTKAMASTATEVIDGLVRPLLVTDATDAILRERFMQGRTTVQHSGATPAATSWVSVFDRLAHRQQSPMKEDTWQPRLEMTQQKIME